MKKVLSLLLMVVCLFATSGCKEKFSFFQNKASNITEYKYYTISQKVSKENLIIYEKNTDVYFKDNLRKVEITEKNINGYDTSELYSINKEEYYLDGNTLYYKDAEAWQKKEIKYNDELKFDLKKEYFSSYKISEKDGKDIFNGTIDNTKISEFMGVDLTNAKDINVLIEVNSKGKLLLIQMKYVSTIDNNVEVSLKPNYSYSLDFNLPISE